MRFIVIAGRTIPSSSLRGFDLPWTRAAHREKHTQNKGEREARCPIEFDFMFPCTTISRDFSLFAQVMAMTTTTDSESKAVARHCVICLGGNPQT